MQHTHWKITQPCHEPIEKMDKTDRGHYCHSCQKEVLDLDEIHPNDIAYRTGDKICGRIKVQQPRVNSVGLNKWSSLALRWMGVSALFFIPLKKGKSQEANNGTGQDDVKEKKTLSRKKIVVGTIRDEKNRPLKTQVTLQDSTGKMIAQTDSIANGRYRLPVDTTKIEGDTVSLVVGDSIQWTIDTSFVWTFPKDTLHVYDVGPLVSLGWTVSLKVETFVWGSTAGIESCNAPSTYGPETKKNELKAILNNDTPVKEKAENTLSSSGFEREDRPQKQEKLPEKPLGVVPPAINSISRSKNNFNKK